MRSDSGQRPRGGRYNGNQPQQQRAPLRNQIFDSSGPNARIRGSAPQIFERYIALAREATISGDAIAAENFYQHAEHYFRLTSVSRESARQGTPPRPTTSADVMTDGSEPENGGNGERSQPDWGDDRPGFT